MSPPATNQTTLEEEDDENEIDLNSDNEEQEAEVEGLNQDASTLSTSKKSKLQERLRKLKLKINQTKQLNHQQVVIEGERFNSKEAFTKYEKQTVKNDKKNREKEQWDSVHSKHLSLLKNKRLDYDSNNVSTSTSNNNNVNNNATKKEIMALTQSGQESIRQTFKKNEKKYKNQFSTNDYYNSEGQLRNYERSLKTIHNGGRNTNSNDNNNGGGVGSKQNNDKERNGAKKLANELKRRAAKAEKRKQKDLDFEGAGMDVSYINKRNKHFNEKINRNYDKHTAEIRQNLERGTAL